MLRNCEIKTKSLIVWGVLLTFELVLAGSKPKWQCASFYAVWNKLFTRFNLRLTQYTRECSGVIDSNVRYTYSNGLSDVQLTLLSCMFVCVYIYVNSYKGIFCYIYIYLYTWGCPVFIICRRKKKMGAVKNGLMRNQFISSSNNTTTSLHWS